MIPPFALRYVAAALGVLTLATSPAFSAPPTTVTVAGEVSCVLPLPTPLPIVLRIEAHARGEEANDLSGTGTQVALLASPPPGGIVENELDPRDPTAALGFANAVKDLPNKTTPGGMLYVFALPHK